MRTGSTLPGTEPLPQETGGDSKSGIGGWLLSCDAIVNALLVAVMISVVWGSIALHLTQQRAEVRWRAERESNNLAQAAAESIGQTITSIDDALRFMRAIYMADPKHFDISAWTHRVNQARGVALEFALIGRDGKLMADSLGPVATQGNLSDQDFFKAHTDDAQDRLFISLPIAGRDSGRWSVLLTRRIAGSDGWFIGVVAASVDPSWLIRLHRSLDIGRGTVMMVGSDGRIRALALGSGPNATRGIGGTVDLAALLGTRAHPDRGTLDWANPVDGMRQIVSYQRLADDDAYVIVGLASDEIFAPYRLYARQYQLFGICITLLILVAGGLLLSNARRLLISRQVLRDAVDAISQGIVMIDARGRVPVINRRASELLCIPESAAAATHPTGSQDIALWRGDDADIDRTYEQVRADGSILEIRTHALRGGGVVRTYADITERKRADAQIIHLALHDSLTGLANRRFLADRLSEAIARAQVGGLDGAVLLVDLDRFKNVNDMRGHSSGDRVLMQAATRLKGVARSADLVARIGGDEFCVLQSDQDDPTATAALAHEIVRRLSEPYQIEGQEILLSASAGIARYPADGTSVDQLLTNADTALYRAKESGRAAFRLYEPAMDVRIAEQRLLEQDLRNAVAQEQLLVVYQPVLDSASCEIKGFEALLRWFHPTRGEISPDEFIPIAEESGVVGRLGFWVLEAACAEATKWPIPMCVAVNLSPKLFWGPDLPEHVAATLAKTGLPAERLVLEVTEGVLIDNNQRALVAMSALKKQGIRIALDDFGTGYASLSYLRRFPFDSIKIDRSFINTLCDDEESRAIVRAILNSRAQPEAEGDCRRCRNRRRNCNGCAERAAVRCRVSCSPNRCQHNKLASFWKTEAVGQSTRPSPMPQLDGQRLGHLLDRVHLLVAFAALVALTSCTAAPPPEVDQSAAQYSALRGACLQIDPADKGDAAEQKARIAACTGVIGSEKTSQTDLIAALRMRASLYVLIGNFADAAKDYAEVVRLDSRNAVVLKALGDAYRRLGRCASATASYDRAIRLNPKFAAAFEARADAALCLKDTSRAIDDLNQAIELEPRWPDLLHEAGRTPNAARRGAVGDRGFRPDPAASATRHCGAAGPGRCLFQARQIRRGARGFRQRGADRTTQRRCALSPRPKSIPAAGL